MAHATETADGGLMPPQPVASPAAADLPHEMGGTIPLACPHPQVLMPSKPKANLYYEG